MEKQRQFENILRCKWSLSVLTEISAGTCRPGELLRKIPGLTKKVLYERLKKLERFGYIKRRLVAEKPLKVTYSLTPLGRKAMRIIQLIHNL